MTQEHHQVLRMPQVQQRLGNVSRSTVYRWVRDGWFPQPMRLGKNTVGWLDRDISRWLEEVSCPS
ncbi:AlpA family phage regulatory protein [Sansalvadorimonas sp. 2012CJ34-2]|uniref:AlpA family phage regulatory protein n=1 Tax=Parendozoicomonas callyspongiae TaxID=2942213 RepID=A0ABT0PAB8_9GAMM|nr:AlpA family phage regulatory protein [Sansalvadorimonas sp. 2012CJ34-2]MCL6268337.1 AlpA family phage regulatory protein [Sansalvadorimonas sp. 2012CJ34-2]